MKRIKLFLAFAFIALTANAQLLLTENFDYAVGQELIPNGWLNTGTAATPNIAITAASITYPSYPGSGIGNEVTLVTGQDVNHTFTSQTSGVVYASFIVNVSAISVTGDYFIHFGAEVIASSFVGRVFVKKDATDKIAFGVQMNAGGTIVPTYTGFDYDLNKTYLIVLKHDNVGRVSSIIVNPPLSSEPASGWISDSQGTFVNPANIGSIGLRQPALTATLSAKLDGVRVATSWNNLFSTPSNIVCNTTTLSNFDYVPSAGPSAQQSFTFSGSNLSAGITVSAPTNFEISALPDALFSGTSSITIGQSGGVVNPITLYARLKTGLSTNNYSGNISLTSSGATTKTISVSGIVAYPPVTITKSTTSLTGFSYSLGNGPSSEKSFIVSGSNLTAGLTISAPTNYEISALSGASFVGTSSMTINQSAGVVNPITIYVRLKSGLILNTYIANISLASTGATTQTIVLNGTVTPPPGINISSTSLTGLNYYLGSGPSAIQSFTVNGIGLTSDLQISAPTNFEISTATGASFVSSSQLTISPTEGVINSTAIYVRLKTSSTANSYSGNISLTSTGATTKTISVSGVVTVPPNVVISKTNMPGFNYTLGNGPSTEQSFTVSGSNLISSINITAPVNFEISSSTGTSFSGTNQILVSPTSGTVNTTSIYIRLKASLSANSYSQSLSLTSTDATTQLITLSGNITAPVGIGLSITSISGLNYNSNAGPSTEQSFTTTGKSLTSFLILTAPTNFEISTGTGASFVGTNQILLSPASNTVTQTPIYVRLLSNLSIGNYNGQISAISSGFTTKYLSVYGSVKTTTTGLVKDTAVYNETTQYKFENLWIQSRYNPGSLFPTDGYGLATGAARGMAVKDGKILICRREAVGTLLQKYMNKSNILVYDGATGYLEKTIPIPDSLFHIKDLVGDTLRAVGYPANDIHVDAAGNVIVANMTINLGTSPFVVTALKLDLNAGTVISAKRVINEMYPLAATARIDAFNVYGDMLTNGYFLAPISGLAAGLSNFVYRWDVINGVTNIDYKEIEIKQYVPAIAKFNNTIPRVKPISESLFYLDGQDSYATLYDMDGNLVDNIPNQFYPASPGNNGVDEFTIGNRTFMVYSHGNTAVSPPSSWAIAELGTGHSMVNMSRMYIFPKGGMGNTSNPIRTAVPSIEVIGNTAYIYVYGYANGLAAYTLTLKNDWTETSQLVKDDLNISLINNEIHISDEALLAEVYSISGQKVISLSDVTTFRAPSLKGIYIVMAIDKTGIRKTQKIVVY